jgi:hypothetical protein
MSEFYTYALRTQASQTVDYITSTLTTLPNYEKLHFLIGKAPLFYHSIHFPPTKRTEEEPEAETNEDKTNSPARVKKSPLVEKVSEEMTMVRVRHYFEFLLEFISFVALWN